MPNMTLTKTPMPEQAPDVRNKNFKEVSLGYTEEMAVEEAGRCLHCKNPKCVEGCPVNIRIPEFIAKVSERDFLGAYEVITSTNALPALSGRVCPQESQCESKCVRGVKGEPVAIGRLERFVADWYRENVNKMPEKPESNGIKVAVVGSGPSGLTCASELAKKGYEVSIFEALHTAGGVLVYGIPEFRLPKAIVANEVKKLEAMGVHVMTDMVIGKVLSIDELFEEMGFKAVFVGSGAGLPMFMHIEGEALKGVMSANEYLTRINLMKGYRDESDTPVIRSNAVAVVGGGNVAMDAARCAKRLGAEHVYIVYRRGEAEMPAVWKSCIMPRKRASSCTSCATRRRSSTTAMAASARWNASAWSSVSRCLRPPPSGRHRGQRVPACRRHCHHGSRHVPEPPHPLHDAGPRDEQEGLPRCQRGQP